MSLVFDQGNKVLNNLLKSRLPVQPGARILEIGCGTGKLISEIVSEIGAGCIEGVEISETMVALARKKNRRALADGRVIIHPGDFNQIMFPENAYDAVCSCNTIYFWRDPLFTMRKIYSILKPGRKIVIAFEDKSRLETRKLSSDIFRLYSAEDARDLLEEGGFQKPIEINRKSGRLSGLCCVSAFSRGK